MPEQAAKNAKTNSSMPEEPVAKKAKTEEEPKVEKSQDSKQPNGALPDKKFKKLHLLIIRHGESESNVILGSDIIKDEKFRKQIMEMLEGSTEAFDELLYRLMEPSLTSLGFAQAERLAAYAAPLADGVGKGGKACMFLSPHWRTCQTGQPLFDRLKAKGFVIAEVKEDLFEEGGIPKFKLPADKLADITSLPVDQQLAKLTLNEFWLSDLDEQSEANGQSERHIREVFGYDTSKMKSRGEKGWCTLKKIETNEEIDVRAQGLVNWLLSEELYQHCADQAPNGDPWVVLVAHGQLNNLLMQKLLGTPRHVRFGQFNTNVSQFSIQHKAGKPSQVQLCSMNQVEHLWTVPHGFGSSPPLPLNYQEGKSGAWNNYGRT